MSLARDTRKLISFTFALAVLLLTLAVLPPFSRTAKAQGESSTPPPAAATPAPAPAPATPTAGSAPPPTTAQPPPKVAEPSTVANKKDPEQQSENEAAKELNQLEGFLEPFIYDSVNRRDPFMAYAEFTPQESVATRPLSAAQRFDLDQLHLVAVMWDIKDPKAMFMDPENEVLVLGRDEGIGNKNGYIASIREGEVVVVEAIRRRGDIVYKTRVLRIER